ncbi:metal-sensing transcriptional repressor [Melioribacteraceae bacterium 4301-Me]|uniref:metal-sensing transcriptional repressor n=1 Tax=Pyranulibacter aquaticus TaxID=3163344 RepID=UPI0035965BCD
MEDSKRLKKQLHIIKGQIEGIEKMIDDDRDAEEIYVQFKAIEANFQKTFHGILEDVLRKNLALKIVKMVNACPGNCPDAEKIKLVQNEFPKMEIKKVASIISEINKIEERLNQLNQK